MKTILTIKTGSRTVEIALAETEKFYSLSDIKKSATTSFGRFSELKGEKDPFTAIFNSAEIIIRQKKSLGQ